jgi:AmmeMemoRadiSam system protein A
MIQNPQALAKEVGRKKVGTSLCLTEEEKKILRQIAYSTIAGRLKGERPPRVNVLTEALKEKRGAFVSLHKHGQLRGCIGSIQPTNPLFQTVEEMAAAAAFDDPRFESLTSKELKDIELEVSVLTPLERVRDVKDIEVGRHGLYIKKGFFSGLLLPQVATDYNWDRITFLEETCRKAGLPRNAWKEKDAEIYLFSAEIF